MINNDSARSTKRKDHSMFYYINMLVLFLLTGIMWFTLKANKELYNSFQLKDALFVYNEGGEVVEVSSKCIDKCKWSGANLFLSNNSKAALTWPGSLLVVTSSFYFLLQQRLNPETPSVCTNIPCIVCWSMIAEKKGSIHSYTRYSQPWGELDNTSNWPQPNQSLPASYWLRDCNQTETVFSSRLEFVINSIITIKLIMQ